MTLLTHSPLAILLYTLGALSPFLLVLAFVLRHPRRLHRRRSVRAEPLCGRCHYVIATATSTCCSECGADLSRVGIVRRVDGIRPTHWPWYPVIFAFGLPLSVACGDLLRYSSTSYPLRIVLTVLALSVGPLLCVLLLVRGLRPTYLLAPPVIAQTLNLQSRNPAGTDA